MDLGLRGRKAIVCAASRGLGRATAFSLAREGVDLTLIARTPEALEQTAAALRQAHGVRVTAVAGDINTDAGREAVLAACPDPDILVNNPGVRQVPGDFRAWPKAEWLRWLDMHFLSSVQLIQSVVPGMCERRFGRIVNMSVSFIKFPQIGFAHSHAARLALSGAVASMVRELIPHNVTINTVCPGLFDTDALHTNLHGHARRGNTTYEAIVADRLKTCPAGRFADPGECGDLIAYICSAQAGFMTGQNIVNDGGVYQGLF
ncbi:MAG: SDR family oxidoreductase [Alphaproteobacteria bacterium]|nr:SDR family oxidoreductase [Alphaproteobacteria bacterium]MCW5741538.1 SDR family oxidoreductase [Alphaproteobacteria bacterium]